MKAHFLPLLLLTAASPRITADSAPARPAESYRTATIDKRGRLHLITTDGRAVAPGLEKDQVGFDQPAISRDGRTVGWLALYPNGATSYPIPLALVIYRNGKVLRRFKGTGLPVWSWRFIAHDTQVGFEQETVHGSMGIHYELRKINSNRLIAAYEGEPQPDAPKWVRQVAQ